jgi:hypothetical protein
MMSHVSGNWRLRGFGSQEWLQTEAGLPAEKISSTREVCTVHAPRQQHSRATLFFLYLEYEKN